MIQINKKENCCGCTACYNICPRNAIKMIPDSEGFLYPQINEASCVDCGLCDSVCPVLHKPQPQKSFSRKTYVLRTKDYSVLMDSTSGGFVTPLVNWILEQNGCVYAAVFDDKFQVVHRCLRTEDIKKMRGSKYVQSNLETTFLNVKKSLQKKVIVCFIGTTCQVNGLKSFLKKGYDNLVLVDLVCHGTPSPMLWNKYLDYQKQKYKSDIKEIAFRNKTYGYHSGTMRILFDNGKAYYGSARIDFMLKSFFKEIASRPSCYNCAFKTMERCSDFTIYDCWHAEKLVPELKDDDKGFTNLIIQSEKGKQIFENIKKHYEYYLVDTEKAVALDGSMVRKPAIAHPARSMFYMNLDKDDLARHIKYYIPITLKDYIIERSKLILYKTGLLKRLKELKNK